MSAVTMILNLEGMQTLMRHLHHNEMRVIYMMALGQEMPASVTKVHLTKIISVLCKIMNWIDNVEYSNSSSNPKYEEEVDIDIDEDVIWECTNDHCLFTCIDKDVNISDNDHFPELQTANTQQLEEFCNNYDY